MVGASIRHGKHNPAVMEFIQKHKAALDAKPSAFFSVSLVARKPGKNTAETNPYTKAFFARSPWQPKVAAVFGGVLDYQHSYDVFMKIIGAHSSFLAKTARSLGLPREKLFVHTIAQGVASLAHGEAGR